MPGSSAGRVGSRVLKGGPSKLRGVIWHKSNGKWEARIYETGKQRFLGYFTSEVSAAKAYDARAVQLHGALAKVNFPEDHFETRNNPPAVKPLCALSVPTPGKEDELPHGKFRSTWNGTSAAARRAGKRKDDSKDEDYVLPSQSRSRRTSPQYSLRRHSSRRMLYDRFAEDDVEEEEGSDSEASLEKGAVEVLATLLSSSDQDGSWRSSTGSAVKWTTFGGEHKTLRASSPPTASTGASPAPAQKLRAWAPPLFVQNADSGSSESNNSQEMGTLQACADKRFETAQTSEDFAESQLPHSQQAKLSDDGSSDSEQGSADLPLGAQRRHSLVPSKQISGKGKHCLESDFTSHNLQSGSQAKSPFQKYPAAFSDLPTKSALGTRRAFSTAASSQAPRPVENNLSTRGREPGIERPRALADNRPTRGSSRFRGVSWCEKGQKWRALLWDGNRQHFLGHFKSEEDGARAYDRALIMRKKKDGCLNLPLSQYQDILDSSTESEPAFTPAQKSPSELHASDGKGSQGLTDVTNFEGQTQLQPPRQGSIHSSSETPNAWQLLGQKTPPIVAERAPSREALKPHLSTQQSMKLQDGLTWCEESRKWRAAIRWGAMMHSLGAFGDKRAAVEAYNEAVAQCCEPDAARGGLRHDGTHTVPLYRPESHRSYAEVDVGSYSMPKQASLRHLGHPACQQLDNAGGTGFAAWNARITQDSSGNYKGWPPQRDLPSCVNNDYPAVTLTRWGHKRRRCLTPGSE